MAAATQTPAPSEISCPDPSAHDHQNKMSAAASTAALYAAHPERNKDNPLGPDGKLSSRGAATSLKYAQPQDLPSFPSKGSNVNAASAAALLAQDHKMKELWYPEASAAGSKAAMLAHKDGGKLDLWQPSPTSIGSSAATLAMKNKGLSPNVDRGYTDAGRTNSLLAAAKSHHQGRQRAGSTPVPRQAAYPDSHNSGKNALNAAAVSHRRAPDGWNSEANQAARVKNIHMDREMFGDHPPVEPEVAEQKHNAALRASAVSMAKSMMEYQNRQSVVSESETSSLRLGSAGADTAHRRNQSSLSQPDIKEEAIRYIHLQDAAHRLAQERLAKVEKDMEHGKYREYYGYPSQQGRQSRFSIRGRGRKRASSEGDNLSDSDDEATARRIRTQMSQLSTAQQTIDDKQRQEDRARLLAAAEKRVHARMHDMDEKVFLETGKPSQAMMDEWESKARERAEKDRAERNQHPGKTHIGGGKYMDQSEIEAIAAARLKPTFDELNDTAEKKRARDEQLQMEKDQRETAKMEEKMKDRETKAEFKRIRDQDKAAAKKEKEERKAAKKAEKDAEKEQKRKSKEQKREEVAVVAGGATLAEVVTKAKEEDAKEEEEQKKDQAAAGTVLADAVEKAKEEDEKQQQDQVAAGETLAEVATRVKTNESEPAQEAPRDVSGEVARDLTAVAPVVAAVPAEESVEPKEEAREPSKEMTRESPKEKPERRSVFRSISNRFKRKPKDEPAVSEPKKSVEEAEPAVKEDVKEEEKHDDGAAAPTIGLQAAGLAAAAGIEEEHVSPEEEKTSLHSAEDKHDEGAAAPVVGLQGAGLAAAGGVEEEHAAPEEQKRSLDSTEGKHDEGAAAPVIGLQGAGLAAASGVEEEHATRNEVETQDSDDEEIDRVQMAGAIAGTAALGAVIAAGSVAAEHRRQNSGIDEEEQRRQSGGIDEEEHISEVSSLSTEDELSESDDDRDLQGVTTAQEHSGAYNFAEPSPAVERGRPDLYRHISTLESSSSSERESLYDVTDEDDERGRGRLEPRPTMHEEFQQREGVPARGTPLIISETVPAAVAEEPDSPVSPLHQDHQDEEDPVEDGKIVIVKNDAPPDAPHLIVAPAPDDAASVAESEPGAPAPVVKSGPGAEERKQDKGKLKKEEKPEEKKEGGGVRGFFRKLKNKSKADNKLQKRQPSATPSESSLKAASASKESETKAPEPAPVESTKDEEFITPVTTTTAALEQEQHMGTDGPLGDPKHVSGLGGDPRPTSPSSFKRGEAEPRDLDDVSSSGADEEDVSRGRAGRLVKKLGLKKDKSKEKEGGGKVGEGKVQSPTSNATSSGEQDQFEEAEEGRDQFDESLAPPPAFGGQMKSGSPVRETRFQEQL